MPNRLETPQLFKELTFANAAVHANGEKGAAREGQTLARWEVLRNFALHPSTVPDVARRLLLSRQSVQRVANRLTEEGFLRVEENPAHQGSPLLLPTKEGEAALDRLSAANAEWHEFFEREMPERERRELIRLLVWTQEIADRFSRGA